MPLEGREQELEVLLERWESARDGAGQLVQLRAEAGFGKTRLVETLVERTVCDSRTLLSCRCSPRRCHTAFAPLHDLLWRLEMGPECRRAERLADPTHPGERLRATLVARLKTLLSTTVPNRMTALNLHPEGQSRKTLEALLELFLESAKRHPILWVVEDLDWIDPSTLELLKLLAHRKPNVSLMVVLTFGPRFEPAWGHRAHLTFLELDRLSRREEEALLDQLTLDKPLSPTLRREIIARADGVPLFLEELVRLARELEPPSPAAADALSGPKLPLNLKQSVAARLERLGEAADVARWAAVLGEELSYDQLLRVSGLDDDTLGQALDHLTAARILCRERGPSTDLAFRHPLIREAVQASLLQQPLREAHRRVVRILSEAFPDIAARDPERMARHYGEADMVAEAVDAWRAAAEKSVAQAANLEAAMRAQRGLELLEALPAGEDRSKEEIALRIALGTALGTAKGYAAPEAQAAYDRALELAWQAHPSCDLFSEMQAMGSYYLARGHVHTALAIAERAVGQIESQGESDVLSTSRRTLGFAQMLRGNLIDAESSLEKSQAPYAVHRSLMQATPPAIGIPLAETLSHLSLTRWLLGHPSQALKHSTDSLTLAKRFNDPFSRVFTIHRACFLHVFRREAIPTRELAHELVELANRHGFLFFIAAGMFLEGQALTAQGRAAEGLQMMSGGLDGVWASGMEVGRPRNLALLAEACGRSELVEQGLSLIKEGIAAVEITGEAHYEPELYRVQGELLRLQGAPEEEIEESLLQGLAIARRQSSRSLELRAAISLGRLWRSQDKARQAQELLTRVHDAFTEGFDTADLKEAKALIDELAQGT